MAIKLVREWAPLWVVQFWESVCCRLDRRWPAPWLAVCPRCRLLRTLQCATTWGQIPCVQATTSSSCKTSHTMNVIVNGVVHGAACKESFRIGVASLVRRLFTQLYTNMSSFRLREKRWLLDLSPLRLEANPSRWSSGRIGAFSSQTLSNLLYSRKVWQ